MNTHTGSVSPALSSDSQPKKKRGFLFKAAIGAGGAFAAFVVWGLMSDRAEAAAKKAHTGVMFPYFQALHEGRLKEAWEKYTTSDYKQEFPFEKWKAAQQSHVAWKPASEIEAPTAREASNLASGGVQMKYYFTLNVPREDSPVLIYDVVETAGGPLINRSYRMTFKSYVSKSGNKSGDSENTPEPW
jgi:hypothetical protein